MEQSNKEDIYREKYITLLVKYKAAIIRNKTDEYIKQLELEVKQAEEELDIAFNENYKEQ